MEVGQSKIPRKALQGHVGRPRWIVTWLMPPMYGALCVMAFSRHRQVPSTILAALVLLGLCPALAVLIPVCCSLCCCCDVHQMLGLVHRRVFGSNFEMPVSFELSEDGLKIFMAPFPCMGCWKHQLFSSTSILSVDVYTRLRFQCTGWEDPMVPRGDLRNAREAAQRPPMAVRSIEEMQRILLRNKKVKAYYSTISFAFLGVKIRGESAVVPLSRRIFDVGLCCDLLREMFELAYRIRSWLELDIRIPADIIGISDEQSNEAESELSLAVASTVASTADLEQSYTEGP
eukprot:gnl/TRDRNA2_/TRDRNA2_29906_c0_seq1.p1 gnl/TRDRNA2_/TRDRNA2_29906_c0~~gnl/TRDRNA2_/TRDRNA2_29906_c0_seq1.p1  ORF type:complete len:288 (+),score=36.50 gnl/TRDRNA2_/TRDRNA2_29906_c0_seq1:166-1029(+)